MTVEAARELRAAADAARSGLQEALRDRERAALAPGLEPLGDGRPVHVLLRQQVNGLMFIRTEVTHVDDAKWKLRNGVHEELPVAAQYMTQLASEVQEADDAGQDVFAILVRDERHRY